MTLLLNPQRIAIWFFDDGSNNLKHRMAVLCTQSFSIDEVLFLVEKLKDFDLFPNIIKVKSTHTDCKEMPMLKFYRKSYDNLIHLVKPYMLWECFSYKVCWRPAKKQWEFSGKFTEDQVREIIEIRKTKSAKEIASQFGVHVNTVFDIISGRSWKHLH